MSEEQVPEDTTSQLSSMIAHIKENPAAYAVGVLVLQQLGWLATLTSELQGVCF
jgi:hypothetical protein